MITEDYVSFETAKLLKEKGFKQWCGNCYGIDVRHNGKSISFDEECDLKDEGFGNEIEYIECGRFYICGYGNDTEDKLYAAPTLQMAMKWLREIHNIILNIYYCDKAWQSEYYGKEDSIIIGCDYETYEEAGEAGIKYCLKNLI